MYHLLWLLLLALLIPALPASAAAPATREMVTRGAELLTYDLKAGDVPVRAYVLRADLRDPYLDLRPIVGADDTLEQRQTVPAMAKRTGAVAALNGDFFYMEGSGRPIGPVVKDGRLLASPTEGENLYAFALTTSREPLIAALKFTGRVRGTGTETFPLAGINKPFPGEPGDLLFLYTPDWGSTTARAWSGGAEVVQAVVEGTTVRQTVYGKAPIPRNGCVLAGSGAAARFLAERCPTGTTVTVEWHLTPDPNTLRLALGGYGLLVHEGRPAGTYPADLGGRAARSAVGLSRDGRYLYLVAVEKGPASAGMTLAELAGFLADLGVWEALNLDGGGSTTLVARPLGETDPVPVNQPQAGNWRAVADALGLYTTAPRGRLKGLVVRGPTTVVAGTYAAYTASGYDEYFNPYSVRPSDVRWSSEPAVGEWRGNVLYARRGGRTTVRAAAGGATGTLAVEILGAQDLAALIVEPASLTLAPGEQVSLKARVRATDGRTFDLPPEVVHSEAPAGLGAMAGNVFTAGPGVTAGRLRARFSGLVTEVPVTVRTGDATAGLLEPDRSLTLGLADLTLSFPAASVSGAGVARLSLAAPPDRLEGFSPLAAVAVNIEVDAGGRAPSPTAPWTLTWRLPEADAARTVLGILRDRGLELLPVRVAEGVLRAKGFATGTLVLAERTRPVPTWRDLRGHWAEATVRQLAGQGVIAGFPDGTFGPQQPLTRAQVVTLLARAFNWPPAEAVPEFRDRVPDWAAEPVAAAVAMGVVKGYEDGTFGADRPVTRAELAVLLARVLPLPPEQRLPYRDAAGIPPWARDSVGRLTAAGLLQGREGAYWPKASATRAEAAALLQRALDYWLTR
ncbi:MAG: S-layer homology domain-containing protein [Desulfotomaculales bacterium]